MLTGRFPSNNRARHAVKAPSQTRRLVRRAIVPASRAVTERMQRVRQSGTDCELRVRKALHKAGLRYRVNIIPEKSLRTRADIVFPRKRIAIFIDGCFWHSCPIHGTLPTKNQSWWTAKLNANRERDERATNLLRDLGWIVLRFWSHENVGSVVETVKEVLNSGRPIR